MRIIFSLSIVQIRVLRLASESRFSIHCKSNWSAVLGSGLLGRKWPALEACSPIRLVKCKTCNLFSASHLPHEPKGGGHDEESLNSWFYFNARRETGWIDIIFEFAHTYTHTHILSFDRATEEKYKLLDEDRRKKIGFCKFSWMLTVTFQSKQSIQACHWQESLSWDQLQQQASKPLFQFLTLGSILRLRA